MLKIFVCLFYNNQKDTNLDFLHGIKFNVSTYCSHFLMITINPGSVYHFVHMTQKEKKENRHVLLI